MTKRLSQFGISEFTTWPWSFERDVDRFADHGIGAIEVCEFKLNRDDYAPQLRCIERSGLVVSSVQSTVHSLFPDSLAPSPTDPDDRIAHMKSAIERISPHVPAGVPFVVITGAAPGGNTQLVYDKAVSALAEIGGVCSAARRSRGVRAAESGACSIPIPLYGAWTRRSN